MDRRNFLKKGALTLAGALVGGSLFSALADAAPRGPRNKRIGLQLYSLRSAMEEDPEGTLKKVAEMGYTELETASYNNGKVYGYTPAEFRTLVEGLGMKVSSTHTGRGWEPEKEDEIIAWWTQCIADHKAMGCRYIIVPAIHIGKTNAELDTLCAYFNRISKMVNAEGMIFGYHNHSSEFRLTEEGNVIYDYLIENTDPEVVFEMDVYWVQEGGADPVEYLKKYKGRFPLLHIKDVDIIGTSGKLDFEPIFEAAYAGKMRDFYVEVEKYPLPPEICVEKSFDFLNLAPYVK